MKSKHVRFNEDKTKTSILKKKEKLEEIEDICNSNSGEENIFKFAMNKKR